MYSGKLLFHDMRQSWFENKICSYRLLYQAFPTPLHEPPNGLRYLRVGGCGLCLGAGKTRSQKNARKCRRIPHVRCTLCSAALLIIARLLFLLQIFYLESRRLAMSDATIDTVKMTAITLSEWAIGILMSSAAIIILIPTKPSTNESPIFR